jgi:hypothetical protein
MITIKKVFAGFQETPLSSRGRANPEPAVVADHVRGRSNVPGRLVALQRSLRRCRPRQKVGNATDGGGAQHPQRHPHQNLAEAQRSTRCQCLKPFHRHRKSGEMS